jgi:hypothetical protein
VGNPPSGDNEGALGVHPRTLLLFADETGHEQFGGPDFPVFGLGGCAVIAELLDEILRGPWRRMKAEHFGGATVPLHAADLRNPTLEQMTALSIFFRNQPIGRFASVASIQTQLPSEMAPYEAIAASIRNRWAELANRVVGSISGVAIIHEASHRGDDLVDRHFYGTTVMMGDVEIPVMKGLMRKSVGEEALEVADFIAHTAGCQARTWASGSEHQRRDFIDIFQANPLWASFAYIGLVTPSKASPG